MRWDIQLQIYLKDNEIFILWNLARSHVWLPDSIFCFFRVPVYLWLLLSQLCCLCTPPSCLFPSSTYNTIADWFVCFDNWDSCIFGAFVCFYLDSCIPDCFVCFMKRDSCIMNSFILACTNDYFLCYHRKRTGLHFLTDQVQSAMLPASCGSVGDFEPKYVVRLPRKSVIFIKKKTVATSKYPNIYFIQFWNRRSTYKLLLNIGGRLSQRTPLRM